MDWEFLFLLDFLAYARTAPTQLVLAMPCMRACGCDVHIGRPVTVPGRPRGTRKTRHCEKEHGFGCDSLQLLVRFSTKREYIWASNRTGFWPSILWGNFGFQTENLKDSVHEYRKFNFITAF
jgi:hypothetical protein